MSLKTTLRSPIDCLFATPFTWRIIISDCRLEHWYVFLVHDSRLPRTRVKKNTKVWFKRACSAQWPEAGVNGFQWDHSRFIHLQRIEDLKKHSRSITGWYRLLIVKKWDSAWPIWLIVSWSVYTIIGTLNTIRLIVWRTLAERREIEF